MKTRNKAVLALTAVAGLGFAVLSATADDAKGEKKINKTAAPADAKDSPTKKQIQNLSLAAELIRYGRQEKNAECLLLAAQILHKTPTEKMKIKSEAAGGKEGTKATQKKNDPKSLVAEAKKMSSTPAVEALAMATDKILEEATRAPVGPVRTASFTIRPYETITWDPVTYRANERAEVAVYVGVYSRMTLQVIDENGIIVVQDSVPANHYLCVWYPKWTGPFRFRLINNDSISFTGGVATN